MINIRSIKKLSNGDGLTLSRRASLFATKAAGRLRMRALKQHRPAKQSTMCASWAATVAYGLKTVFTTSTTASALTQSMKRWSWAASITKSASTAGGAATWRIANKGGSPCGEFIC